MRTTGGIRTRALFPSHGSALSPELQWYAVENLDMNLVVKVIIELFCG